MPSRVLSSPATYSTGHDTVFQAFILRERTPPQESMLLFHLNDILEQAKLIGQFIPTRVAVIKKQTKQVLARVWRNWNPHVLLVGM